jgi:hypothetical protein
MSVGGCGRDDEGGGVAQIKKMSSHAKRPARPD